MLQRGRGTRRCGSIHISSGGQSDIRRSSQQQPTHDGSPLSSFPGFDFSCHLFSHLFFRWLLFILFLSLSLLPLSPLSSLLLLMLRLPCVIPFLLLFIFPLSLLLYPFPSSFRFLFPSGLACGQPVRGRVCLLGGPLFHLSALRQQFNDTLQSSNCEIVDVPHGHLLVAQGAAENPDGVIDTWNAWKSKFASLSSVSSSLNSARVALPALFLSPEAESEFHHRHPPCPPPQQNHLPSSPALLKPCHGPFFLGLDCGSTTSKLVLIDDHDEIVWSNYRMNNGEPLKTVLEMLFALPDDLPEACLQGAGVTGCMS